MEFSDYRRFWGDGTSKDQKPAWLVSEASVNELTVPDPPPEIYTYAGLTFKLLSGWGASKLIYIREDLTCDPSKPSPTA